MRYFDTYTALFLSRPNRFVAEVNLDGEIVKAHVKNTGRRKELLITGVTVILQKSANPNRTTQYDLIAVIKGERLINIDSYAPNRAFHEFLQQGKYIEGLTFIKPESTYGNSRFDFYAQAGERKIFIEVKGVTLEENGVVMFPDAPTLRGIKHLQELGRCVSEGYEAHAVFIIQMEKVKFFTPNNKTHPQFGQALNLASAGGVTLSAFDCIVTENSMTVNASVPIVLGV